MVFCSVIGTSFSLADPLIIANPVHAFSEVTTEEIRSLLLLKTNRLKGQTVTLNIPAPGSKDYHNMAIAFNVQPYALERWWARARYAGLATLPKQFDDSDKLIRAVFRTSQTIGIVPSPDCSSEQCLQLIVSDLSQQDDSYGKK